MELLEQKIESLRKSFPNGNIPIISEDIRFWMVRSKKGFFYDEFVHNGYIAVGWNCITKDTDMGSESIDAYIKESHPDVIQYTKVKNKCDFIMNRMKQNDIIVLPNRGMREITIALVGEYYEDKSKTIEDENLFDIKIKNNPNSLVDIECPYIKRRKISVLRKVDANMINYHLYQTLRNYNGVDDIDERADLILGLLYNAFIYNDILHISLEVNQSKDIPLSHISGLLYGTSRYFDETINRKEVTAKINVSSEGTIDIAITKALETISAYGPVAIITLIAIIVLGYMATKIDIPKLIKDLICIPTGIRQEKIKEKLAEVELEMKKEELKEKQLKNRENESPVNVDAFVVQLLSETGEPLQINIDKLSKESINALSYIEKNNEREGMSEK